MKYLLLLIFISTQVFGDEWQFDVSHNNVEYVWIAAGTDNAHFDRAMVGVGITKWFDSGLGARLAYAKGGEVQTKGRYEGWILDMRYISSFEIMYRKEIFRDFSVYIGIGTYQIPLPIWNPETGYFKDDRDDDEGWLIGFTYMINDNVGASYRFTKYSRINNNIDEWTSGYSSQLFYRF